MKGWRRWVVDILAVVGAIGLFLAGMIAARSGSSPWQEIAWSLILGFFVWWTFKKLTSKNAVDDDWDGHIRYGLTALSLTGIGLAEAVSGGIFTEINRVVGGLGFVVGLVMLVAEIRDCVMWRAAKATERREKAGQARAQAEERRRRAW